MICTADRCRSGLRECTRTECGYADETESAARVYRAMNAPITRESDDVPIATPAQAMGWPVQAIWWIAGAVGFVCFTAFVYTNWPLIAKAIP